MAARWTSRDEATPLLRSERRREEVSDGIWRWGARAACAGLALSALGVGLGQRPTIVRTVARQGTAESANDLDLIEWVGLSGGMTTDGQQGYLKRTVGGNSWDRGAYSARAITKVGDEVRGISGDCMRTDNRHLQFGLSSTPSGHSHTGIDYAVFCNGNQARFQERGVNKYDAGVYAAGETFQVIVNDAGAVEFYVDGDLKYTSSTAPSFPLYADTSFHNHLATLANARWISAVPTPA